MPVAPIRFIGGLSTDVSHIDATSRNWYRIDEVNEQLQELNSMGAVFYRILEMFRKGGEVSQPKYMWWRNDVPAVLTTINGGNLLSNSTVLTVVDATIFTPRSVVMNQRTQELMTVTTVDTTTQITVVRGRLGTVGQALTDGDGLMNLGPALPEKGTANLANAQLPVSDWNYVSFFSIKKQVTELQEATDMRFNINMPTEMKRGYFELQRQVNQALLWSRKAVVDDATYGRYYYCDGFIPQIMTNRLDLSAVDGLLTWPMFNDYFRNISEPGVGSPSRTIVCGTSLFAAVNQISYNQVTPVEYSESLGTQVRRIATDEGLSVDLVLDRHSFPGTQSGMGIVVDLNQVELKAMRGYGFKVRPNIQDNDSHIREDEIYGSASVQVMHEEVHGLIEGCVGPY